MVNFFRKKIVGSILPVVDITLHLVEIQVIAIYALRSFT